ncbi:glutathione S-transferase [Cladophialophora yegresii CBS 114405]|uniref:Glutathione S-transferase n=1 Tax=Cladophialophora yegresii CBS 114405 TaxID=1182544 RepID=W9VFT4_9EURO|nr:glutathione S-transferase [Cladophialophora yegresii CBS 114405]EXJ54328.1 glutathione S-transferase [Cladophialophora yegresii CBS 114405]
MGSVDTSLHKHTSGRAAKFASSHESPHPLILYGGWFCPFVQRSWITLHEKRIPHQYFEINPYHKDPEFLKLNPRGLVPTLAVPMDRQGNKQKPLYESQVICEYLDEVYDDEAQHGRDLLPRGKEDAYLRAKCRIWIDHISTRIIPAFYRFMQHTEDKAYSLDEARQEFLGHIKTFVEALDPQGPFFLGERFSMVDIMLAPWLCRMFLFDVYKGGVGIPEEGQAGKDEEVWKRWSKWAKAVGERESVQDTLSDRDQYIDAYRRYAEDKTQSQVGQATRSGRGLP